MRFKASLLHLIGKIVPRKRARIVRSEERRTGGGDGRQLNYHTGCAVRRWPARSPTPVLLLFARVPRPFFFVQQSPQAAHFFPTQTTRCQHSSSGSRRCARACRVSRLDRVFLTFFYLFRNRSDGWLSYIYIGRSHRQANNARSTRGGAHQQQQPAEEPPPIFLARRPPPRSSPIWLLLLSCCFVRPVIHDPRRPPIRSSHPHTHAQTGNA
jgi:hypothetical protein